jgi:hypothetical protein
MSEWKQIETAPKDGTRILVCRYPYNGKPPVNIAYWSRGISQTPQWWIAGKVRLRYEPTMWMEVPIPSVPK